MALDTYANLQVSIADWLNRDDLTARIPDFITLAEAKIRRDVRRKTVRATLSVNSETTALPSDCAELRSVYPLTGSPQRDAPLRVTTPEGLAEMRQLTWAVQGRPIAAAIIDGSLVLSPIPNTTYSLQITYFQKLQALSGSNTTNVVLTEAPDIYLYGALAEAAPYLEHDERIVVWQTRMDAAIEALNDVRTREETSASLRSLRLPVVF